MKRYNLITPEGTKDMLFEDCLSRRDVEKTFRNIFKGFGYSEVVTPGIEFYDVFNKSSCYFPQESLYKLSDSKGRLIVLRPDSTIPIARMVATRLKEADFPLRLFYNQSIFSINPSLTGRSDEIVQAGIELIGSDSKRADLEAFCIAIKSLSSYDEEKFRLEIGDIGFFKEIVSQLEVDESVCEEIRHLIEVKNYPALNDLLDSIGDNKITRALKHLPRLFGGVEVLEKASQLFSDEKIDEILDNLKDIYNQLDSLGYAGKITFDLGIVNRTDYYTGVVFRGYLYGYGEAVLSGGRYDKLISEFGLDIPATGFGINVDAVAKMLIRNDKMPKPVVADAIVFGEQGFEMKAFMLAQSLVNDGKTVENAVVENIDDVKKYAVRKGICELYIVGKDVKTINLKDGAENE